MNLNNYLLEYYQRNKVFFIAFVFSVITYSAYLIFRGFGWDGDSFISASQFIKVVNRDLYHIPIDGGAHPKFFTVFLLGEIYQITGGFYFLTFISIILNSLMVSTLCNWVNKEKGLWIIALTGLLINIPWTKIVINCDNTAFSIPFIVLGLYFASREKYFNSALLLTVSNFFRSGSEFIIVILIIHALYHKKPKNIVIFGIALAITLIHSNWGYFLVYPSREIFWNNCWTFRATPESIAEYQYSIKSVVPYIQSVFKQLLTKYSVIFIIPAIIGLIRILKYRSKIVLAIILPADSLILPVSTFLYGTILKILETKHMGYTILLPVLAAFSINSSILEKMGSKIKVFITSGILLLVILFSVFTGNLKHGDYEAHVNGTGIIGWTNFPDIKHDVKSIFPSEKINILTAYQYLTFVILDVGKYANNIDVIRTVTDFNYTAIYKYELLVIPIAWKIDSKRMTNSGYTINSNNNSYVYYISASKLPNS